MDYRSPFEIRQQIIEETRAAKSNILHGASPISSPSSSAAPSDPSTTSTALPDDPTALVCEIPGAENIKALNAALEQEEAVQRYLERENLSLEDSAKYIMANGSTAHKISFFGHVRDRMECMQDKRISKVLSILLDSMWAQDPELQCHAPEDLLRCLPLLSSSTADDLFEVTKTMLTVKTAFVREAWGRLLLGLAKCLSITKLEHDMIPLVLSKTEHAQPQDQRELSCDLLGVVCHHIPPEMVDRLVLSRALALCQDTNVGVRQHMCQQLSTIAHSLGIERAKETVAPELFELLNDEERCVSRTAFSCLIDLVEFFGPDYRRERLYPIIKSFISNPPSEVVGLLVGEFGRFLDAIKGDIATKEDVLLFAGFYQAAAGKVDGEARRNCAFNLPAVAASLPPFVFPTHLSLCCNGFASDPVIEVRMCAAAGMHELVHIFGDAAAIYLEQPFLTLLSDADRSVRTLFFLHIRVLLDCFVSQLKAPQRARFFASVASILLRICECASKSWRSMSYVMEILGPYMVHFNEVTLADSFVPYLLTFLKTGANALKDQCAQLIVGILVQINNVNTKVQILSRLNNEFARSTCCYQRQSYLRFVREACQVFSHRFIRERVMECCFELQRDTVSSVRLALARVLPFLHKSLCWHHTGVMEDEFRTMMQRLLMDDDADVRSAAHASEDLIALSERDQGRNSKRLEMEEKVDQCRASAEQEMLDMAKECDKAERRAKLRDLLKSEREREHIDTLGATVPLKRQLGVSSTGRRAGKVHSSTYGGRCLENNGAVGNHTLPKLLPNKSQQQQPAVTNARVPTARKRL